MASKFEITLIPRVAAVIAVGSVLFTGVVCLAARFGARDEPPYRDYPSPDGRYAASIEHGSLVNVTVKGAHGRWWTLAEGQNRIAALKWLAPKTLQVLFVPGNQNSPDDPQELPRERSRFFDVAVTYKLSNSSGK